MKYSDSQFSIFIRKQWKDDTRWILNSLPSAVYPIISVRVPWRSRLQLINVRPLE